MSLLDYLRLSDRQGNIHSFVKKQYALEHRTTSLENFVNKCRPTGELLVAAIRYSRGNPNFFKQWLMMHVPFRQIDDLWIQRAEVVPADLQGLALCLLHRPRFWRSMAAIRREMELEAYRDVFIETRLEEIRAATELIDSYLSGMRQVNMSSNATEEETTTDQIVLSAQQRRAVATILSNVKSAIDARTSAEDPDADEWKDYMAKRGTKIPVACLGAAGTGKSVVAKAALRQAMQNGAVAAVACPTGLQSAAYRCSFPDAHVETVHSFFGLHAQEELTLGLLSDYDLIVVEEVGQITCAHFERIWRLWEAVDRRPVLLFVGDFMQLPAIDDTSARDSRWWKEVYAWEFATLLRSECAQLSEKLALLRHHCPNEDQLRWILRNHRASVAGGTEPTVAEVATVLAKHPNATLVTYTRRAAAEMNRMAVSAFFEGVEPVAWIPADPDSNAENFRGRDCVSFAPNQIAIHIGMRLSLTRNINKGKDHVNGMSCIVEAVNQHSMEVRTASGRQLDNTVYRSTFFPVRLGYATTLHKVQGSTLEYMAVWLDKPNVRAAGYVALSRVRRDNNWCFFGQLTVEHFTPWRRRA
ncbi:Pif1 [Symbiodinium microadriaticum]|nr:Pif1 [Symbiodinium microadriaticum]